MASTEAKFEVNGDGAADVEEGTVAIKTPSKDRKNSIKSYLPVMFERAAKSWWNPKFDSDILENEFLTRSFRQLRRRFRYALIYITFAFVVWCIYASVTASMMPSKLYKYYVIGTVVFIVLSLLTLAFTFLPIYRRLLTPTSVILSILLCVSCLLNFGITENAAISEVGTFASSVEIILMMYTVIPLPLYLCVAIGVIYSLLFEALSGYFLPVESPNKIQYHLARLLLHCCIHIIGSYICLMTQVRRRSTFFNVGQSILSRRDLEIEKELKKRMINSLMPEKVARELMLAREEKGAITDDENRPSPKKRHSKTTSPTRGQMTFRNFHMSQMQNVSILFADIVGFTKMSSNKTAEHLVSLLNELFGDFDIICAGTGCEKICTLGDCYYSVSGCPEPCANHASCCVEMGLSMCVAIQEFDIKNNEEVNMRVGVHTGMVLCGLVGTRRFKFDVWSHDVNIANTMESDGKPGMVHISDSTYQFVKDDYEVDPGEAVEDIRKHKTLIEYYNKDKQGYDIKHIQDEDIIPTWFITSRKNNIPLTTPHRDMATTSADGVTIQITPESTDKATDVDESNGDAKSSPSQHKDAQGDGLQTTALLSKKENATSSMEELSTVADDVKKQLHAQSVFATEIDNEIVTCMRKGSQVEEYLYNPPINKCTLNFKESEIESQYREHYLDDKYEAHHTFTLSRPRFSSLLDMVMSLVFLVIISICCFLAFNNPRVPIPWLVILPLAFFLEIITILPLITNLCMSNTQSALLYKLGHFFSMWWPRHIFGAVITSLPAAAVYSNFDCGIFEAVEKGDLLFCLILLVALLHYCNFTMLSSWMKSILATMCGLMVILMISIGACNSGSHVESGSNNSSNFNETCVNTTEAPPIFGEVDYCLTIPYLDLEILLNMFLLLSLIWFLNREFEINYRLTFHGDMLAEIDKKKAQDEKEQADWLLHNIIPEHVSDVLKKTSQYCKNHSDVGVVFAKIVNYDDFYDESYEGGKEYLRVLNEMMGDFEDLFDDPRFKDVEKIKTIGSCLMIAAGLNPKTRDQNKDPKAHLYALIDFCVELLQKLEDFNAEIFNFNFKMAIGFNHGPVTAGVIGTTKLLYDIWGDTVNVSSRMYSTGMAGKIQVTEECAKQIEDKFVFEYRGQTYVKGKGDLNTYLLASKKEGAVWS